MMNESFSSTQTRQPGLEDTLRRSEERLQRFADMAHEGIWEIDKEGKTVFANRRLTEILGYSGDELSRLNAFDLVHSDDAVRAEESWSQRMGGKAGESEWRFRHKEGDYVWLRTAASPVLDEEGRIVGALAIVSDITDKKRVDDEVRRFNEELEKRVEQRTAQLQAINKELETFCYSVSHDLRAPLRTIRGFSEVVIEQYAAKLDERGQDFLRRVQQASNQMDKLIEDLLKLSRASRGELQTGRMDLSAMASEILLGLQSAEPAHRVETSVAPDLTASGDERLVRAAMDNLLRNAWKFTGKTDKPRIEVGRDDSLGAFFVRDNGAGFDMAYVSKLFGPFQRLHSPADFPGSGVGLAIVQRIINRHGGRVWAEARPNAGATFYFTLPPNGSY